ncbi:hypothetical protein THAOC_00803 [Thalassiosira oceanica]|uniref:Uncharacterized protein n=1 Tax=Thalassiosira oceanica TaxID=159749 RepID=K0TJM4_THAOC|nr:hypothetical protein THAOC_00803 [Thalassiosira oceanica]|eukprot:EJK77369.1 hypothetical protein THAOC_00803 [Thalassiosira oceanica]
MGGSGSSELLRSALDGLSLGEESHWLEDFSLTPERMGDNETVTTAELLDLIQRDVASTTSSLHDRPRRSPQQGRPTGRPSDPFTVRLSSGNRRPGGALSGALSSDEDGSGDEADDSVGDMRSGRYAPPDANLTAEPLPRGGWPRPVQGCISWTGHDDEEETPGVAQSGLDEDGALRCGVRGAKMKLTRKKRAGPSTGGGGVDDEREMLEALDKHLDLHTREQRKRQGAHVPGREGMKEEGRKVRPHQVGAGDARQVTAAGATCRDRGRRPGGELKELGLRSPRGGVEYWPSQRRTGRVRFAPSSARATSLLGPSTRAPMTRGGWARLRRTAGSDDFAVVPVTSRGLDFMREMGGRGALEKGADQFVQWDLTPRPSVARELEVRKEGYGMGGEATRTEDNVQPRLPPAVATRYWSTKICSRRKTLSQRKDGRKDASFSRYILVRERGGRESTLRRGSGRGATGRRTQGRAPPSSVREIARVLRGPVYRRVCREGGGTTFLARDVSGLPLRPRLSKGARSAAGGRLAETPPRTGTEQLPEASNHRSRGAIPLGGLDRGQHPERTITDGD